MEEVDVLGIPWQEAKERLEALGFLYEVEQTRPTRDFFPIDEQSPYVVRQRREGDKIKLVLAARLRKEVSCYGLQDQ